MDPYTPADRAAILGPLTLLGDMTEAELWAEITDAARQAMRTRAEHDKAPDADEVSAELRRLADAAGNMLEILGGYVHTAGPRGTTFRKVLAERIGTDADRLCGDAATSSSFLQDLRDVLATAEAARQRLDAAHYETDGLPLPYFVDGVRLRPSAAGPHDRRGRNPDIARRQFGVRLAVAYASATGLAPTCPKRDGHAYGPFLEFLTAAIRPTGLLPAHRSAAAMATAAVQAWRDWTAYLDATGMGLSTK